MLEVAKLASTANGLLMTAVNHVSGNATIWRPTHAGGGLTDATVYEKQCLDRQIELFKSSIGSIAYGTRKLQGSVTQPFRRVMRCYGDIPMGRGRGAERAGTKGLQVRSVRKP